ncbi:MAG: branched-chain amino acid ABC transporter substrate-binding protein [Aquabacterium sp.]|jgi:branched-chain amino acid transport system substrate-binding protein|nr:MAG: branched-chain amino acid ABC transporter substrate-binding protein [Aquabacterium sp.]
MDQSRIRRLSRRAITAAAITSAVLLAACSSKPKTPAVAAAAVPAAQPLRVRIGQAAPLSGPQAEFGLDVQRGAQLAVDDLNSRALRIGGRPATFELVSEDDHADPERARGAAQRLLQRQVAGVVGHLNARATIAAAELYAAAGVPAITPSATDPQWTASGWRTSFRLVADDGRQAAAIARYAARTWPAARVAVVDNGTPYGKLMADSFADGLKAAGLAVQQRSQVDEHATNFRKLLARLRQDKVDLLFVGALDDQVGPLLRQVAEARATLDVVVADAVCGRRLAEELKGSAADGRLWCGEGGHPRVEAEAGVDAFARRIEQAHPENTTVYSPLAYDAVQVLAQAMVAAGSADPAQYLPQLARTRGYQGLAGPVSFDTRGDNVDAPVAVFTLRKGEKVRVGDVQ